MEPYSCAFPQLLQKLNVIQSKALTLTAKVNNNANGKKPMPFEFRRKLQHLKYHLKIHSLEIIYPVQDLIPIETRPGQRMKAIAKLNDSFATLANKIEMETGVDGIPVAMYHVSLPIDCHAPFLIKQATDKTPFPPLQKYFLRSFSKRTLPGPHAHIYGWVQKTRQW